MAALTPDGGSTRPMEAAIEEPRAWIKIASLRDLSLIPVIIALLVIGTIVDPVFLTTTNITNVLQQQTELSLVVLAEAIILISGKFDLSLESTVGLAPAL